MTYFTEDHLNFFKELAANNDRDWFQSNKERYELSVKEPFLVFIQEVIDRIAKLDTRFEGEAKQAVYRIYRDVRFSRDKTPYKLKSSANIAPGGRKDRMGVPGLYLEVGPENFRLYSGLYQPERDVLHRVRKYIVNNLDELDKLVSDKDFVTRFGGLRGEKNKILPKEFKAAAEIQPLLFNKQFYFFSEFEPEIILQENFADLVMEYFEASEPMRTFLTKARGVKTQR